MSYTNDITGQGNPVHYPEPDPAAGSSITFVVDSNLRLVPLAMTFKLKTVAGGITRKLLIIFNTDTGAQIVRTFFIEQAPSVSSVEYNYSKNGFVDTTTQTQAKNDRMPDIILLPGYEIEVFIFGMDAADELTDFSVYGETFLQE